MAATNTNNPWEKVELALVRFVVNNTIGVNESNVYAGHDNAVSHTPRIVCECASGESEIPGTQTGIWLCQATIYIKTKLHDETGMDNSGRFAAILDALEDPTAAETLSSAEEFFTVLKHFVTGFRKSIQGDTLVSEIGLSLTCCGSVIN